MIKLSRAFVTQEEVDAVTHVLLEDGYLGMGRETAAFEKELQEYLGGDVELATVNTGTSALHIALQAAGVGAGDEVLVPSLTYIASFQAISATGATPIACDISEKTGCLDVQDAAQRITPRTRAIMPVHYGGNLGDLEGVYALAKKHGLRVIEDAAHSFGGNVNGRAVGAHQGSDITCFSFDNIKTLTCGEGGCVVSRDAALIAKVKDLRLLGVEGDSSKRETGQRSWDPDVKEQGWRYHLSNIYAAIGRVQLKRVPQIAQQRRTLAQLYCDLLKEVSDVHVFEMDLKSCVPHIFPIVLKNHTRQEIQPKLLEQGIETGLHYKPNHLLTKYRQGPLPVIERLSPGMLTLPLQSHLTEDQVYQVVDALKKVLQ